MTQFLDDRDDRDDDGGHGDDEGSFHVELASGDIESGFHTKNDPDSPYQRSNVVQRKGAVDIKCTCVDIVHGRWGPEDAEDAQATLLVLLFRFDSRRKARRVAQAHMEFAFFDAENGDRSNPEVAAISFDNSYSLAPTKRTESKTKGAEGTVGSNFGAEVSGTIKWEVTVAEETTDAAHLVGSIDRLGAMVGPFNAATWTLSENATTKKGVPAALRVGILLKRSTDADFHCTVKVKTKVDLKTGIEQLFGGREEDDPILFRVDERPTNKLMNYDVENLGSFDVSSVEDVTVTTVKNGVVKEQ
ncbi:hypothetical protein Cob_v003707 [Colletotrichum orbiculare MAFF 240422]|uniref:Uncharacterized protein n=1 Tax=Colletotrichum orbiculare (strain 104-T / ATCC 96160 / CBS 514.97 / LARS 414 / MAFF 240422) TaxID=1213857 RepID=A0A484G0U2_COLOR|nr:hypothetical protein Cob_v003707 [Colletotrichum orbiculare MAFF 240422]